MQKLFMVEFDLPSELTPDFVALIPRQRELVQVWLADGRLKSYTLSLDRSLLWAVFSASDARQVHQWLREMPLHEYMMSHVTEAAFHLSQDSVLSFSLN